MTVMNFSGLIGSGSSQNSRKTQTLGSLGLWIGTALYVAAIGAGNRNGQGKIGVKKTALSLAASAMLMLGGREERTSEAYELYE